MLYDGTKFNFRVNQDTIMYCLPALIYFLQNNIVFLALLHVDPTTYQILVNLKILTTGILSYIVLNKKLSSLQWSALFLLAIGCAISQSKSCSTQGENNMKDTSFYGIILCIIVSIMSPAAGIATEWIMKKSNMKNEPLHSQNMHLYFFGILFNIIGYIIDTQPDKSFFDGHSWTSAAVILSYAFTGLMVSLIMKYADNMVKIYAVAVSMALTLLISVLLFEEKATVDMFYGITVITLSIFIYFGVVATDAIQFIPHQEQNKHT